LVLAFIESLGVKLTQWTATLFHILAFWADVLGALLSPATWNRATFNTVIKQVYFTAVQTLYVFLPFIFIISWVLTTITLTTARSVGLFDLAAEMSVRLLVLELLPFLTALFVALRSGSAINTEVALMKVNNELDALDHCQVPPLEFEFLPRVVGGILAVTGMSLLAGGLSMVIDYFLLYGASPAGLGSFSTTIANVFSYSIMLGLIAKCVLFGLVVTSVPISAGMETPKKMFMVPVSVLKGMMRVFFALVLIEVISLALKYI
jgi:phospholipid/cholesterol/gamma-HCH transport system permease protein